jgi:hypothetical protein
MRRHVWTPWKLVDGTGTWNLTIFMSRILHLLLKLKPSPIMVYQKDAVFEEFQLFYHHFWRPRCPVCKRGGLLVHTHHPGPPKNAVTEKVPTQVRGGHV